MLLEDFAQSYSVDNVSPLAPNFVRAAISTQEDTSLHYSQSDKMFAGGVAVRSGGVGATHFLGLCRDCHPCRTGGFGWGLFHLFLFWEGKLPF